MPPDIIDRMEESGEPTPCNQSELIEQLGVKKPKCYFTTDISEELSCCSDGNFDSYGFPENICEQYPCEKFKKLCKDIRAAELAKAPNEQDNRLAQHEKQRHRNQTERKR